MSTEKTIEARNVPHPEPAGRFIYGRVLQPGEVILATDVYSSSNGKWEPAPCPGCKLGEGVSVVWVRPVDPSQTQKDQ